MDPIKITEKQKKYTLNAQKKAKAPKNVLTSSLPEYWPTLSDENTEEFAIILKTLSFDDSCKSYTTFGLQSALRNFKNCKIKYLILDDGITPRWFAKHLMAMTLTKDPQIKIIIVPKLKEITKEAFTISTIIMSINMDLDLLQEFYLKLNVQEEFIKHYSHIRTESKTPLVKKRKLKINNKEVPIVHLKKETNNPAFVPSNLVDKKMETESSDDFICLKKYEEPAKSVTYHPMKIKQVFPNPNRKKK